jgi:hypothetical protein
MITPRVTLALYLSLHATSTCTNHVLFVYNPDRIPVEHRVVTRLYICGDEADRFQTTSGRPDDWIRAWARSWFSWVLKRATHFATNSWDYCFQQLMQQASWRRPHTWRNIRLLEPTRAWILVNSGGLIVVMGLRQRNAQQFSPSPSTAAHFTFSNVRRTVKKRTMDILKSVYAKCHVVWVSLRCSSERPDKNGWCFIESVLWSLNSIRKRKR